MTLANYTIIGCGDIGLRVARELIRAGHRVHATAHFAEGASALEQEGIHPIVANFDYQDEVPELPVNGHGVFYFLPPQGGGSSDYRMVNFCRRLTVDNCPRKLVYISTSGVYGDCGGQLVTEETPLKPLTSRAKRRVSAENQLGEAASRLGFRTGYFAGDRDLRTRTPPFCPVAERPSGSAPGRVSSDQSYS